MLLISIRADVVICRLRAIPQSNPRPGAKSRGQFFWNSVWKLPIQDLVYFVRRTISPFSTCFPSLKPNFEVLWAKALYVTWLTDLIVATNKEKHCSECFGSETLFLHNNASSSSDLATICDIMSS